MYSTNDVGVSMDWQLMCRFHGLETAMPPASGQAVPHSAMYLTRMIDPREIPTAYSGDLGYFNCK